MHIAEPFSDNRHKIKHMQNTLSDCIVFTYNFTALPVSVYLKVLEIPVNVVSPSRPKKPIPL